MEVLIDRLDHQGRGIGKIDNKTIFVYNALPNELVDVEVIFENKKFMEGRVIKYLKTSDKRIESKCPYFKECGGCDLWNIEYSDELKYKENKVRQIIEKFSNIDTKFIKQIVGNKADNYRNKATFHVKCKVGYYKRKSNEIIPIDKCLIVDDKINKILDEIKKLDLTNIYELVIRTSHYLDDSMIVLKIKDNINEQNFIDNLKDITTNIIIYKDKKYKTIYGEGYIFDMIGEYKFKISPDSFFQVNTVQAKKLYDKVLEYLEPNNDLVLDLYCGTGTIGIYVSKYCKKVYGIEINEYAIEDAFINKKINNIDNIDFRCLDTSDINIKEKYDKIIVDPPRSGLDKKTVNYLLNSESKRIVYVSCDPVTLSRDLDLLSEKYNVIEITPVDMFSRTYHVENVCLLERI